MRDWEGGGRGGRAVRAHGAQFGHGDAAGAVDGGEPLPRRVRKPIHTWRIGAAVALARASGGTLANGRPCVRLPLAAAYVDALHAVHDGEAAVAVLGMRVRQRGLRKHR